MENVFDTDATQMHAALRAASAAGPLMIHPLSGATVVLRHADIEAVARDPRLAGVGLTFFDLMGITSGPLREWYAGLMFTNEGPAHDRLRILVSRAFTPRSVEALRDDAARMSIAALQRLIDDGGGDLKDTFALVAMRVMCRLLGVPEEDVAIFGSWADALSPIFGFMEQPHIDAATDAITKMLDYTRELADRRRTEPADDLISRLLAVEDDGDILSHEELVQMVANLLVAGHDTTTSQIGCSLLTMLTHPDQAARVRDDPDLVVSATEETIRYEPSIPAVPRTAVDEIEIAGTKVEPGAMVLLCTAAANREPQIWDEPDNFDVGRFAVKGTPRLLTFGAGPHFCLGAALARMTVQEVVRAVATHAGRIRLAHDPADIAWTTVLGRSPAQLLVETNASEAARGIEPR